MKRKPVEEEKGNRKFRTKGNGKNYVEEIIIHAEKMIRINKIHDTGRKKMKR